MRSPFWLIDRALITSFSKVWAELPDAKVEGSTLVHTAVSTELRILMTQAECVGRAGLAMNFCGLRSQMSRNGRCKKHHLRTAGRSVIVSGLQISRGEPVS